MFKNDGSLMPGDRIYEPVLDSIYRSEIEAQLEKTHNTAIRWKEIASDLKVTYPQLGADLVSGVEKRFRDVSIGGDIRALEKSDRDVMDWSKLSSAMTQKYPGYHCESVYLFDKAIYFTQKKRWPQGIEALYLLSREDQAEWEKEIQDHSATFNDVTWDLAFIHGDQRILTGAIKMMKVLIGMRPSDRVALDTYANLLYKNGNKSESVDWERKAIAVAPENSEDRVEFLANLTKMQAGQPTWTESETAIAQ